MIAARLIAITASGTTTISETSVVVIIFNYPVIVRIQPYHRTSVSLWFPYLPDMDRLF